MEIAFLHCPKENNYDTRGKFPSVFAFYILLDNSLLLTIPSYGYQLEAEDKVTLILLISR